MPAGRLGLESLEQRTLLSLVTWGGGEGTEVPTLADAPNAANATCEPGPDSQLGFNLVSWWNFESEGAQKWSGMVQDLHNNGYRCVSFVPVRYVDPATGVISGGEKSPEIEHIAAGIAEARRLGMTVTVNPFVEPLEGSGVQWRGDLQFSGAAATEFFRQYRDYLSAVAAAAESNGAARMTIGSELAALTANPAYSAEWSSVIDTVAGIFHGSLGYAANWNSDNHEYDDPNLTATVWENPHIDFVGVDFYPPLATVEEADASGDFPDPAFIATVQANCTTALASLRAFAEARKGGVGMPIVLTEVGFIPYNRTTTKPNQRAGDFIPLQPADPSEQTNAFMAVLNATEGMAGSLPEMYVWHWGAPGTRGSDWYIHPAPDPDDPNALSDQTAQLLHAHVTAPFEIQAAEASVTITEGREATAAVRLHCTAPPLEPVAVTIASRGEDPEIVVDTTTVTFDAKNWRADAYVKLHALSDADAINGTATLVVSAPGIVPVAIQATELDKDGPLGIRLWQSTIDVREGRTGGFQVSLTADPKSPVTVTTARTSGDAGVQVQAHGEVQFDSSNWDQPQWVALVASEDADEVDETAIFTVSAPGMTSPQVTVTVKDSGPPGSPVSYDALVDDYQTLPLQGETQAFGYYNRLGGDRGAAGAENGAVVFGRGCVGARLAVAGGYVGAWHSLNHPMSEGIPLDLNALLPKTIKPEYQYRAIAVCAEIEDGKGQFALELKDLQNEHVLPPHAEPLSGGAQTIRWALDGLPADARAQSLNWILTGQPGSFVKVKRIWFEVQGASIGDRERFVWPYAWLLGNFDANTGLTRDRAEFKSGDQDGVNASGAQAALAAVAAGLNVISTEDARGIVTKTRDALLRLQREEGLHGLLQHFIVTSSNQASGTVVADATGVSGTEYSTIDTLVGLGGVLIASQALGLPTADVEQAIRSIDWTALTLDDGTISHGYSQAGELLTTGWDAFGGESLLVALFCAASTGKVPTIKVADPAEPRTYNGSGFIDELPWLFVDAIAVDVWGVDWSEYRQTAADRQVAYFDRYSVPAFGLSAVEPPIPSQFPVAPGKTVAIPYVAYGIGGVGPVDNEVIPPNDGSDMFNQAVAAPHYSGMVASLEGEASRRMWDWMQDAGLVSPLNSVESLVVQQWGTALETHYHGLKGSWNSALEALGAGATLMKEGYPLHLASRANAFVASGLGKITINNAPVLNPAKSPVLNGAAEDAGAPAGSVGTLISSLVDFAVPSGQVDNVTDANEGALLGIAVTAADAANGSWWWSIDGGGAWNPLSAVSSTNARLLAADADARVYFQPSAGFNGTLASAITFRAWDRTSGDNGGLADTSVNGGTTAFSADTDTASIVVSPVNDAPVLDPAKSPVLNGATEDAGAPSGQAGTLISSLVDFANPGGQVDNVTDADEDAVLGIAVTAADAANGSWWWSIDGGGTWNPLSAVSGTNARLLAADADTRIYFQPNAGFNGTIASAITLRAWDRTSGGNGALADTSANGGTTAFSVATDTASIVVAPINDAPALDPGKSPVLNGAAEDAGAPTGQAGTLIASLVDFANPSGQVDNVTDADEGAVLGIAVTAADAANGAWWWSIDGGGTWNPLSAVSSTNARLLAADANTRIYFQPNAGYSGTIASAITFRAWDRTSGDNGGLADTSANGGTTAFSVATDTASIVVQPVNQRPSFVKGADQSVFQDSGAAVIGGWATSISAGPADESGQALDFRVSTTNHALFSVPPAIDASGTLTFTPAVRAVGQATVTVVLHDDGGTEGGGKDSSDEQTFTITVGGLVNLSGSRGYDLLLRVNPKRRDQLELVNRLNPSQRYWAAPADDVFALTIRAVVNKTDALTVDYANGWGKHLNEVAFDAKGGSKADSLAIKNSAKRIVTDDAVEIAAGRLVFNGVSFATMAIENVTIDTGAGNDSVAVSALTTNATWIDSSGRDHLNFTAAAAALNLNLAVTSRQRILAGNPRTLCLRTAVEQVTGTAQADRIKGSKTANRIEGGAGNDILFGGAGNDVLLGGEGDDRLYGEAGRDELYGGPGNNLLLGGDGSDRLDVATDVPADSAGRNLLIGGKNADALKGGPGQEILIGGTTRYDSDAKALAALMQYWATGPEDFADRCNRLARGIPFGKKTLSLRAAKTVFDDRAVDTLHGAAGQDWFFGLAVEVQDRNAHEDR